jgi:hypothetical protein
MVEKYEEPALKKDAFTCPTCGAFAAMSWQPLRTNSSWQALTLAFCHRCKRHSVWLDGTGGYPAKMLFPESLTAPLPNEDLPEECMKDYMEARGIANNSPRGAAALLRLCIQKLAIHLGGDGKNINDDIGALVKNGLPQRIQQALDVVRVVGNNAVHPGEMVVDDQPKTVHALFGLINLIVDNQITQPKQVGELFSGLPEGARAAVERRDK